MSDSERQRASKAVKASGALLARIETLRAALEEAVGLLHGLEEPAWSSIGGSATVDRLYQVLDTERDDEETLTCPECRWVGQSADAIQAGLSYELCPDCETALVEINDDRR